MGCFSCVCIVSKLPIYGHEVVGIPIIKDKYADRAEEGDRRIACYPNTDYYINGFPFFGENDDYGRIENYESGKYHKLNVKLFGAKGLEEKIDNWSQPTGKESIMYIHRPVWDEIQKTWRKQAAAMIKRELADDSFTRINIKLAAASMTRKQFEEYEKKMKKHIPDFKGEYCGIPYELTSWCNQNYDPLMDEAILDLMALDVSCLYTHTIYMPTYTIGEQISDWKAEAKWTKFLASFAGAERKKVIKECAEF